ncbi:probable E3 ubiquitin-protein ligase HERC4 isoform X2 [Coccinella septempunctata]|uniref:probable E3 ubiquitin-protein ligase HERC4 isoform X2 n=1 Tax=Coccinella septempunctata TaxID=41139 RepID=UPI001D05E2BE|nr:probable E3 ubiquitin-protein ligase HERC4 isoform X2 [Coccinella septempunctata]
MFVWGSTVHGELGVGGIEDEHILVPQKLDWFESGNVISTALGDYHTLLLTVDGKVYSCGDNDYGQLGHELPRKRPHPVSGLDAHFIVAVACGKAHSLALNKWGQVFAWGSDSCGQLGHQLGQVIQPVPKIVKSMAKYHVVQIACGSLHSVALCNSGEILCWGGNSFGELGIGHTSVCEPTPVLLTSLLGIPFAFISCGSHHTFALSKSGAVFGWGKNIQGQLGLNDTKNKVFPCHLRTLRSIKVRYMNCGEDYSTFLTLDGGVFSCGSGTNGQLGHGTTSNEILPKQIFELMGSTITQISCGRKHTLAFVPSGGRVYSFGVGGSGQLGLKKTTNTNTPQVVKFPWLPTSGTSSTSMIKNEKYDIQRIFAGGDRSIVLVKSHSDKNSPYDCRYYEKNSQIEQVNVEYMKGYLNCDNDTTMDQDFMSYLEVVFKSLQCLNGSFLLSNNAHYWCTSKHHGVDMELAEKCFSLIGKYENDTIKEIIWNGIVDDVLPKLSHSPPDVETLRIYLILPLYHEFNNPRQHQKLHKPFANALLNLGRTASLVVGGWWRSMTPEYFEKCVNIFKSVVPFILRTQKIPENKTVFYDPSLVAMLDILSFLNKLNHLGDGFIVPYNTFHLSDLSDYVDIRVDYLLWLTDSTAGKLFLCNYPFIFDAQAKTQLLETDQSIQMQNAMQSAAHEAFLSLLLQPSLPMSVNQYLVLNIDRRNIVSDTLRELSAVSPSDLKKPLKVKFLGEEAEDAGGVSKEFFLLVIRRILDPDYGMFVEYEETRALWFSKKYYEDVNVYGLIGMILGLAIYNFTIINTPFPLALYKKLLDEPIVLSDLKGLKPTVCESLQKILEYDGDDFVDTFCLTFTITEDIYDERKEVPLKTNGEKIPVTQENKQEYVQLYIDYIFNESVKVEYETFHDGFMKVCGGRVLKLFHSHELMAVVVGNENYDWHALEEATEYKNGFESSSQTIRWFWEVIHEMSLADKRKFLLFLTGSDRIPIQGMGAIKIIIQKTNDDKYLPVAHTCFNLLDLPEYRTKERLRYKLMQAIQQTEGFSLV